MNAPCTFILKNDGITQFFDVSYISFNRNGDKESLIQNVKSPFTKEIKELFKKKDLKCINTYSYDYRCLYNLHRSYMLKNGKFLKELGQLSEAQVKKCKKAVECLVSMVTLSRESKKNNQYLAFVTLTLPTPQKHHDSELRKCLTRYIENLQKTYGVKHYVWKAEPQKNGNIHFHLIIDKYIHHETHRFLWNKQIGKLGYLDAYCEKHGNRNPNSTDVHSLKNKRSVSNYLLKYLTKPEPYKRPILGALWGCANATKKLEYPRTSEGCSSFYAVNDLLREDKHFKNVLQEEFFGHYVGRTYSILKSKAVKVWNEVKKHFLKMNNLIIPKKRIEKPFVRPQKYESIDEMNTRIKIKRDSYLKAEKERKQLIKYRLNYNPFQPNQLQFSIPVKQNT
ncbi:rolling circle replication-associated protein [Tenacibaculum soleae]|uniref:rolling circle replication-associated protein n=1 Tax=Tenacibaculum soleae TaxID=447689 RepID=UPI0022FFDA9E|nr:hypothetical protein [Tenacibaculum soleae]